MHRPIGAIGVQTLQITSLKFGVIRSMFIPGCEKSIVCANEVKNYGLGLESVGSVVAVAYSIG